MKGPLLAPIAAGLALSACTHLPVYEEWEARPSHPALPAAFIVVDSDGIDRNCGSPPGLYVYGCASRDYGRRACLVYTRVNPESWLVEHEKKHCEGWDHVAAVGEFPGGTTLFATPVR